MRLPLIGFVLGILLGVLALTGCTTVGPSGSDISQGYAIDAHSRINLATHFNYAPSFSGYFLPAGTYKIEAEDANGFFFRAPSGAQSLSFTGKVAVDGGIYLPKKDTRGVRGYAYLQLPVVGRSRYFLPDAFFSGYGTKWTIGSDIRPPPSEYGKKGEQSITVVVEGDGVDRPGRYFVQNGVTLQEILNQAGIAKYSNGRFCIVRRSGDSEQVTWFRPSRQEGPPLENVRLQDGDLVFAAAYLP